MFGFKSKKRKAQEALAKRNEMTWYGPMTDAVTKDGMLVLTIEDPIDIHGRTVARIAKVVPLRGTMPTSRDDFKSTGASKWSTVDFKFGSHARNELLADLVHSPLHIHSTPRGFEFQFDKATFKKQLRHAKDLVRDPKLTRELYRRVKEQDQVLQDSLLFR